MTFCTTTKSPNDAFLRKYPRRKAKHDHTDQLLIVLFSKIAWISYHKLAACFGIRCHHLANILLLTSEDVFFAETCSECTASSSIYVLNLILHIFLCKNMTQVYSHRIAYKENRTQCYMFRLLSIILLQ